MTTARVAVLATAALLGTAAAANAVEYRFPDDANIVDVKRDFGARGNGRTDDTEAIREAVAATLNQDFRNPKFIYFPNGTYVISKPINARVINGPEDNSQWCNGWRCGLALVGQTRERTVFKLKDRCPGFTDPSKPRPMIATGSTGHGGEHGMRKGGWGNEGFQNTLMNFTVDTGRGNPGAIGVDFLASNRGTMEEITVRSGDTNKVGVCGIDMTRPWPGPALVKSVSIDGFDYALRQKSMDCSMTYEHITATGQRKCVVQAIGSPFMSLRKLISRNDVPVFEIEGGSAVVNVLDSSFSFTGRRTPPPAIISDGYLVLKNIDVSGYPVVVAKPPRSKQKTRTLNLDAPAASKRGVVKFFSSRSATRLTPGADDVPDLPVKETPTFHHLVFSKWANPNTFATGSRTAGIQEAIDSGAEIVYLPNGSYTIQETIVLRGKLRKLMGCEAKISHPKDVDPMRFDGVDAGTVLLEHVGFHGDVVHNCDQTLSIRKSDCGYRNTIRGTGDVFLEDGMFNHPRVLHPQNFYARQMNSEFGDRPNFTNRGGRAWILGFKVEGWVSAIRNIGGITECYALYAMTGGGEDSKREPFVENREGWLAVSFRDGGQGNHFTKIKETWEGKLTKKDTWHREFCLALGGREFDPASSRPGAPGRMRARAASHEGVELSWGEARAPASGIVYYRISRNGEPIATVDVPALSFTDTTARERTSYRYEVAAVGTRGGISSAVRASVRTPADTTAPVLKLAAVWPADHSCMTIDFDEPVDAAAATATRSYRLSPGVRVTSARLDRAGTRAILEFAEPLDDGQEYTLTCSRITDRSRAHNNLSNPTSTFTAWLRGDGLRAEFWNGNTFDGRPVHSRIDRIIDYWWGQGSPGRGVTPMNFSARWSADLRPKLSGEYVFNTGIRTGGRLYIDGELVHDVWNTQHEWTWSRKVRLEARKRYRLVFETYAKGHAGARLKWQGPGINGSQFISPEFLFAAKR